MAARDRILSLLRANPLVTASQLVAETGVSRQRVYQLLKEEGLKLSPRPAVAPPARPAPRVTPLSGIGNVNHSACGMIGELLAACDLLARGWRVFSPLVRHSKIDLVATSPDGAVVKRIEVRSGKRKGTGVYFQKRPEDACDHYAVIIHGEPVHYIPDIGWHK